MEEGTVVEWLKSNGEPVEAGEMLFSVESDKAITEVEALDSGVLYIPPEAPIGSPVPVGSTVGYLLAPGEPQPAIFPPSPAVGEPQLAAIPPSPAVGRDSLSGTERAWGEAGGGEGYPAVATASPRARRIAAELGIDLATVTPTGKTGRIREADVRAAAAAVPANGAQPRMSPSVKRMVEESGIDVRSIPSSGPAGRVTRADLTTSIHSPLPRSGEGSGVRAVPMSAFRRAISQRMSESARTVAAVTLTSEADATELVRLRESLKAELGSSSDPLPSYNDLLTRLVAKALGEHPHLNASIDGEQLLLHDSVHIGLAVDAERGLLAPVIRNADRLGVFEIAAESARLIAATRDGSIERESLTGATFTITNLGMFDIDAFTPIINLPEAAVLGVGRIVAKPVVIDEESEQIAVRKMMTLSLTFDHRIVDGAPAARFLQDLKNMIERPLRWLM